MMIIMGKKIFTILGRKFLFILTCAYINGITWKYNVDTAFFTYSTLLLVLLCQHVADRISYLNLPPNLLYRQNSHFPMMAI